MSLCRTWLWCFFRFDHANALIDCDQSIFRMNELFLTHKGFIMRKWSRIGFAMCWGLWAGAGLGAQELKVKITPTLSAVDVVHAGQKVRIQRIQDTGNKIIDDFAKTSRPCPEFCIHAMVVAPGVETLGELELLDFMTRQVPSGQGLVIDARLVDFHKIETIPTSINIPFTVIKADNPHIGQILIALGAEMGPNKRWNYQKAKSLALWCNGPWCDQSSRAIQALLSLGYPAAKLKYYRGGMQMWKLMGLTTVVPAAPRS
jgi:rhodanese-related sulfurtransferase